MLPTELLDFPREALISIFNKLDLESLVRVGRASKRTEEVVKDDFVWMELCRQWENVVDVRSWRVRMDSGKALYRLLRSFSKLSGLWSHRSYSLRGELLYVIWGVGLLEGWQVIAGTSDADEVVRFMKLFEVVGKPDGTHDVDLIFADQEPSETLRLPARIVLPSAQSQDQFTVELCNTTKTHRSQSNEIQQGIARGQDPRLLSTQAMETDTWPKLYKRLAVGNPNQEQELAGLWTGLYGPHGWEILNVSYPDDHSIVSTKIIGDPNVPSGEVSFQAHILDIFDNLPNQESRQSTKMYKGRGRIAEHDFVNPTWVSGFLHIDRNGNFAFVWADNDFAIQFHRLDIEASFRSRASNDHSTAAPS